MALKPNGRICQLREQIIEDKVSGLTLQIEFVEGSSAPVCLRIFGDLPYGNREFLFNSEGELGATGTALASSCRANWLKSVKA